MNWEPGLVDGPTSSRIAVVDYNADTGLLTDPATWADDSRIFCGKAGEKVRHDGADAAQF